MTSTGNDQEVIRQSLIALLSQLSLSVSSQIASQETTNSTLTSYQKRIGVLNAWIVGDDISSMQVGNIKSTIQGSINRVSLLVDSSVSSSISLPSSVNSIEEVILHNQQSLSALGVSSLQASYTFVDNSTAPADTVIYIDAYDAAYQKV